MALREKLVPILASSSAPVSIQEFRCIFEKVSNPSVYFLLKVSFSEKATKIWHNRPQGFDITK